MNISHDANGPADEPPNRELDDLITRHLDAALDPAEQRRLAALLASSPEARRTLAGYLRLEGATIRLASAGLFGQAATRPMTQPTMPCDPGSEAEAVSADHATIARPRLRRPTSMRPALVAVGGGLLAAAVVAVLATGRPSGESRREGDLDLLASRWVELQRDGGVPEADAADAGPEGDDTTSDVGPPPRWLVAAVIDAGSGTADPDDS